MAIDRTTNFGRIIAEISFANYAWRRESWHSRASLAHDFDGMDHRHQWHVALATYSTGRSNS